jgi:hypothetical protein
MLDVPMASAAFPTASATLLLEVPMVSVTFIVPNPAARVESNVEAVAASIQYLEEVPLALTALPMPVPTATAT